MKLAHFADVPWRFIANPRQGRIEFKEMLCGEDGSLNNYCLVISRTDRDFVSPRHRHNFDQVRLSLENPTNIGHRLNIEPGDIAYFPEGCHYGPQTQAETGGGSLGLVVQFGGASGAGYMSMAQMERGAIELREHGNFENGVFRAAPGSEPRKRNQDGYEAIWSHVNGKALRYPRPRYGMPVFLHTEAYVGTRVADNPGVTIRHLASFTERHIDLALADLEAGATWQHPPHPAPVLLFAMTGSGRFGDNRPWTQWSAVELAAGATLALRADTAATWFRLALPNFSAELAAA